jgi:hypothetical protein
VLQHVRRVAKASPDFARSVAWLHDVLEESAEIEALVGHLFTLRDLPGAVRNVDARLGVGI